MAADGSTNHHVSTFSGVTNVEFMILLIFLKSQYCCDDEASIDNRAPGGGYGQTKTQLGGAKGIDSYTGHAKKVIP